MSRKLTPCCFISTLKCVPKSDRQDTVGDDKQSPYDIEEVEDDRALPRPCLPRGPGKICLQTRHYFLVVKNCLHQQNNPDYHDRSLHVLFEVAVLTFVRVDLSRLLLDQIVILILFFCLILYGASFHAHENGICAIRLLFYYISS